MPIITVKPLEVQPGDSYWSFRNTLKRTLKYTLSSDVFVMGSRYEDKAYHMLTSEPVTPSEIAQKLRVTYKTAQRALMQLALTRQDVSYRNSGRIHLFWKKNKERIKG